MPTARWGNETVSAATEETVKDTVEDLIGGWCVERLTEGSDDDLGEVVIGDEVYRVEINAALVPTR
jgi:hypothetical protein